MRRGTKALLICSIVCCIAAVVYFLPRMPSTASQALNSADRFEVFSLDPSPVDERTPQSFRGYRILGSTVISDSATQTRLSDSLRNSVDIAWSVPRCFSPRHAVRVTHGAKVTDFLICFECFQVEVWEDRTRIASWITSTSPQRVFDDIFQGAGIPMAVKK